ncbi:MAG: P-loop NTPase [Parvularculaceae bacterium]
MDRIREAVTRARTERPAAPQPAKPAAARPDGAQRFSVSKGRATDRFREISCDFDRFAENRIISNEQDPVLNAYRVLRTRVLQRMEEHDWKTLAIVSPGAGAGKSVTAINLAIAIGSKQGSRATLVDLDFYRPRIAKYLGIKDTPSILDFFEGKTTLPEVTVRPDLTDVLVIGNERVSRRGAEHLTSARADRRSHARLTNMARGSSSSTCRRYLAATTPSPFCRRSIACCWWRRAGRPACRN